MENQRRMNGMARPTGVSDHNVSNKLSRNETKKVYEENQSSSNTNVSSVALHVQAAAEWLSVHRDEIAGAPIPFVKEKFGLNNAEAIDALTRGRNLRYARAL